MMKIIRHQLWNQRRQNGWIFVELVVVSFFLWTVIDPIYVLTSNLAIDPGYNEERAYALYMEYYDELHGKYDKTHEYVRHHGGRQFLHLQREVRRRTAVAQRGDVRFHP